VSDPLRSRLFAAANLEEDSFRSSLRGFVDRFLIPIEVALDAGRDDGKAGLAKANEEARKLGVSPLNFPESWGGPGLPLWAQIAAREEVGYSTMAASTAVKRPPLALLEAQSEEAKVVARSIAAGTNEVAFALSEGRSSSTFYGVESRLSRTESGFRLNGVKEFISGASTSTHLLVFARDDELGEHAMTALLVATDSPGISVTPRTKISWRGYPWSTVVFSDVAVEPALILGSRGGGARLAMGDIGATRLGVAAHYLGTTARLLDLTLTWARGRDIAPGVVLASGQAFRWELSRLIARFLSVRALVERLARSSGEKVRAETSSAKLLASELAGDAADFAVQAHGGSGLDEENVVSIFFRDARAFRIGEGTTEIQLETIARNFLEE